MDHQRRLIPTPRLKMLQIILQLLGDECSTLHCQLRNESKTDNRNRKSKPQRLFICDLGVNKKTQDRFVGLVKISFSRELR